jgi:single-strand DNA-binding protein
VGRDGTPVGQACTADSGQTKRNGAKHHVQQNHPHLLIGRLGQNAEAKTTQNKNEYVILNIATQESWKSDKGDYENRTEWHRVYAWRNLSRFAKTLQKGQPITLEGVLRYREIVEDVEGAKFKHRIAEIHAISVKRLSKVEAADDPSDGAGEE